MTLTPLNEVLGRPKMGPRRAIGSVGQDVRVEFGGAGTGEAVVAWIALRARMMPGDVDGGVHLEWMVWLN
jgi:hypothetical protein